MLAALLPRWLCLALLALSWPAAAALMQGQPLIQRYTAEDYGGDPTNHDLAAAPDGAMFVANSRGVLRFDGTHWDLIELPGLSPARSLRFGADGQLYVGSYDRFGRIETDATGHRRYVELRDAFDLDFSTATFGSVWDIIATRDGMYLRSDQWLFFYAFDGRHQRWPNSDAVRRMGVSADQVHARVQDQGFSRFADGRFVLVPGGEQFADKALSSIFELPDGMLLVSDDGFYRTSAAGIRRETRADVAAFAEDQPNAGLRLADGSLLIGTNAGNLLLYSNTLELLGSYPLGPYSIIDLEPDREGGVWASTQGGLARLRLPSPWSGYTTDDGLTGVSFGTAYFNGHLWVAGTNGVLRGDRVDGKVRFSRVVETELEAYTLLPDDDQMLIGERGGLQVMRADGSYRLLLEADTISLLQRDAFDRRVVWASGDSELLRLIRSGDDWTVQSRWPLEGASVATLEQTEPGLLWTDNYRGGPLRWRFDPASGELQERREFGAAEGLQVDPDFGSGLNAVDDQLYVISGRRVYRIQGERFVDYAGEPFNQFEDPYLVVVDQTEHGDFAYTQDQLLRRIPGTRDWQPIHLGARLARGFSGFHVDTDGKLRATTSGGVLQFDPGIAEPPLAPLKVTLSRLARRDTQGELHPLALDSRRLELISGDSLVFDYTMVAMDPGSEFRFRVDGVTNAWGAWTAPSRPALSMRNPGPGQYTLQVEARTRSGRLAEPLVFEFEVAPLWWQTRAAQLGGVFLAVLLLLAGSHAIARFRYRQYLAINRKLEAKIAERTSELEQANRKLAELATEDSLTGVANRRALEQGLRREWDRCAELGQPLALIMVDVDHFKQYNDRYGHLEGDQQLIRVARELAGRVRPVRELLARFGGEEFAVILPGVDREEASARAETIRAAFDRDGFATTVSVGVSAEVPLPNRSPTDLLRAADEALYAAKRAGRNRVMLAA